METYLEGGELRVEIAGGSVEVTLPEFVPDAKKGFRWRVIKGTV